MSIWSSIEVSMTLDRNKHMSIRKLTRCFFEGSDHNISFQTESEDYVEFSVALRGSDGDAFNYLSAYRDKLEEGGKILECQVIVGMG